MTTLTERDSLAVKIVATQIGINRILLDLAEDEGVLAELADGAPPPDVGWEDEDECAEFVTSTRRKVARIWADLDGLYGQLEELLAAEETAA